MSKTIAILFLVIFLSGCHNPKKNEKAMDNNDKQRIIENFIQAYNTFNINGMLKDIHKDIKFENISNGQIDITTIGINEFKKQAEHAKTYFTERQQKIIDINFEGDRIVINVDYFGILAKDLSDELKSGDTLRLNGKSIFRFKDNKIIYIQDISE